MADSDNHLEPGHAGGLGSQYPSPGPSSRPSGDDARSQDELLSGNAADNISTRQLGDSVPDAPPRVQEVSAEDPTHATNRELG